MIHLVHLRSLPVAEALKHFQERLTEFEQEEVMDFPEIWFMGLGSQKIEGSQGAPQNSGYDDEHGSYIRVNVLDEAFKGQRRRLFSDVAGQILFFSLEATGEKD